MDLRPITPLRNIDAAIRLPGSKSFSHRYLVAAALSGDVSLLRNVLAARDLDATIDVVRALDIPVTVEKNLLAVYGRGGRLKPQRVLQVGESGTTARLALALAALSGHTGTVDGSERMRERPMEDMVKALRQLSYELNTAPGSKLPITIYGNVAKGGEIMLDCSKSSQYLSALLLIAPLLQQGLAINVSGKLVSQPYVDMTIAVMRAFGVEVRQHERVFQVPGGQKYQSGDYTVETDASQAAYFWAAAAIAKGRVLVRNISLDTCQGDIAFPKLLESMGCQVSKTDAGVTVSCSNELKPLDADLGQTPDIVPTLAVVAAYARGVSVFRNVEHLQYKESNRIEAVINELRVLGINARFDGKDFYVAGDRPRGGVINTYNDHRIAMSFAVAGLGTENVVIKDPQCVAKSFPAFWEAFDLLAARPL